MSNVYSRTVDLAGGGGGGGALIVATRSDNSLPALFANFAALEAYTATASGTADALRINVSNADNAREVFAVGALDGNNQVSSITAAYIRLNGDWVAVATNLVGTPGQDGQPGQDGSTSVAGVTDRRVPFNDGGTLADSPMRVMGNGDAFIEGVAQIESGTLAVGPFINMSERGGFLGINNADGDEYTLVDFLTPRDAASRQPRILELTEAENEFVIQAVQTEELTSPIVFEYQPSMLARINAFIGFVGQPVTNLRFQIERMTAPTSVIKYWPSQADWLDDNGRDFGSGMMVLDLEDSELPLSPQTRLRITIRFDSGSLLGDTNGVPALTATLQRGQFTSLAFDRDTIPRFVEVTGDINITDANIDQYNRRTLYVPSGISPPGVSVDINIMNGLAEFDFIDIANFNTDAVNIAIGSTGDTGRINGENDVRVVRFEGGRIIREPGTSNYVFVYSNTDPDMMDNFVDSFTANVSGQTLSMTLGRNGALGDLSQSVTLPATTATPQQLFAISTNLVIDSSNVGTYDGNIIYLPSSYVGANDITVTVTVDLNFVSIDFVNFASLRNLVITSTGAGQIDGQSSVTLAPTHGGRLVDEPGAGGQYHLIFDSNAGASTEQVQDIVGDMVTGNTETGIAVTYDDTAGKLNFEVTATGGSSLESLINNTGETIPAGQPVISVVTPTGVLQMERASHTNVGSGTDATAQGGAIYGFVTERCSRR